MYFPSRTLLLCLWLIPTVAYKLPLLDGVHLTDDDNTIDNPSNSPFGTAFKWEWQSQDRMDETALMLARLRREIIEKKFNKVGVKPDEKVPPKGKPTEPSQEELSDTTQNILKASSAAVTKAEKKTLLKKDETTPFTDLDQTSKGAGHKLDEKETTTLTDLDQTSKGAGHKLDEEKTTTLTDLDQMSKGGGQKVVEKETTTLTDLDQTSKGGGQKVVEEETTPLVTKLKLNPTTAEKLSVLTINKYNKVTKVNQIHSTDNQFTSNQETSTNNNLLDNITSSLSPKAPSPKSTLVISHEVTTEHGVTTVRFSSSTGSSAKPAAVTHIATSIEEKVHTQYIMRQCMLTVLILAIVCTIFIISTIALAAKLSTMKQKNKLRHPATYTEMRCISSLLPDSDQQMKPRPKRLKTFTSNMEESDGDNATLNSFLPDH